MNWLIFAVIDYTVMSFTRRQKLFLKINEWDDKKYCNVFYKMLGFNLKHELTRTLYLMVVMWRFYFSSFMGLFNKTFVINSLYLLISHGEIQALNYRTSQLMINDKWVNRQIHQLCCKRGWNTFNSLPLKKKKSDLRLTCYKASIILPHGAGLI